MELIGVWKDMPNTQRSIDYLNHELWLRHSKFYLQFSNDVGLGVSAVDYDGEEVDWYLDANTASFAVYDGTFSMGVE